jgi:hypothetical protein
MKDNQKPKPCPSCKAQAPRMMPTDLNGTFNLQVDGPGPQNTGVAQLDAHIDRVIGQSANQGWSMIDKRVRDKKEVLAHHPEATGYDLSRNVDGSYRVLKPEERRIHDRANALHREALKQAPQTPSESPR